MANERVGGANNLQKRCGQILFIYLLRHRRLLRLTACLPPPAVNMKIQLFFLPKYLCTEVRRPRLSSSEYVQLGVHFGQSGGGGGQCPLVASE